MCSNSGVTRWSMTPRGNRTRFRPFGPSQLITFLTTLLLLTWKWPGCLELRSRHSQSGIRLYLLWFNLTGYLVQFSAQFSYLKFWIQSFSNRHTEFGLKEESCRVHSVWRCSLWHANTWTMTRAGRERLEAFEIWVWWLVENVKDGGKLRQSIECRCSSEVQETGSILNTAQRWKLRWIKRILRHESLL